MSLSDLIFLGNETLMRPFSIGNYQPTSFWNWFWAASLGSTFYVLIKTQPYLVERTFDPKYNNAYVSRLITGIVGGVILAYVLSSSQIGGDTLKKLGPAVIAIIGGFASEAVQQILQRIAEVITSAVRGDNSAQVKAQLTIEQAQKAAEGRAKLSDALAALKQNNPADAIKALDALDSILTKAPSK
jgi:DMSO reductase anchor subunit